MISLFKIAQYLLLKLDKIFASLIILLCISFSAHSQDFERVDASILLYPKTFDNVEQLSRFITRDFFTEEEKVRAMYSWIVQNVAYDPEEYKKFDYTFKNYREFNELEEKTREKIIKRTLQKGIAVCEGYAMLFEKLCEQQGIKNYLVRGDTKASFSDIGREFKRSHMWNVITIDGKPYLFDVTWGAGKFNGKFIKEPTYFYYKTPPELFIKSHYPDMFEDAFTENVLTKTEFSERPLIIEQNLLPQDIQFPFKGILYGEEYFSEIAFNIDNVKPNSISYNYGTGDKKIENVERLSNGIKFNVPIALGQENLLIYFDGKPALGYRIIH